MAQEMKRRYADIEEGTEAVAGLAEAMVRLRTPVQMQAFLEDLCTPAELEAKAPPDVRVLRTLVDLPNVDVVVRRLVDRGLVYRPTRGTYDFALPLFGSYLRRRAELTELTGRR